MVLLNREDNIDKKVPNVLSLGVVPNSLCLADLGESENKSATHRSDLLG